MGIRKIILKIIDHKITPYTLLTLFAFVSLSPLYWMFISSFKGLDEIYTLPPTFFPAKPTWDAFKNSLHFSPVPTYFKNSVIVAVVATLILVAFATLAAYSLSQYRYKGSGVVTNMFLVFRAIPPMAMMLPFYILLLRFHLINTYAALIIFLIYLNFPLAVWLLKLFFDDFPRDLIDAARVDGCSRIGTLFRIVLPVTAYGLAATGVICFMFCWNEFFATKMFMTSEVMRTIPVGVYNFMGEEMIYWNEICTMGVMAFIPSGIFFVLCQRHIVRGLAAGAVKA